MKKIVLILILSFIVPNLFQEAQAINVGMYQSESEYGLLDAFKVNWRKKERQQDGKFIKLRDEVYDARTEKSKKEDLETEYERTRYIYQGQSLI